eukprot:8724986-Karenia_brevis.AAC.1
MAAFATSQKIVPGGSKKGRVRGGWRPPASAGLAEPGVISQAAQHCHSCHAGDMHGGAMWRVVSR